MFEPHHDDVGHCTPCGRWQRRRHAYAETFGPGDRVEWCVTGNCLATWGDGVQLVLAAEHSASTACRCSACVGGGVDADSLRRAADTGLSSQSA